MVNNNDDALKFLNRHKKNISCDLCRKRIWFFSKGVRFIIRTKDNIWIEYYHVKCLEKRGFIKKLEKVDRFDNSNDEDTALTV